jgi:hypothetical protein
VISDETGRFLVSRNEQISDLVKVVADDLRLAACDAVAVT